VRWQRTARFAIAAFVIIFAGIVFVAMRRTPPVKVTPVATPTDPTAVYQAQGRSDLRRVDKTGKLLFSVTSTGQRLYPDGRSVLEHATLILPDRDGRTITIVGDEAETLAPTDGSSELSKANLKGNVRLTTSDGLTIMSSETTYDDKEGLVNVPGPVTFTRGRMTGKGVGATYDRKKDVIWLLAQAQISVTPDETDSGKLDATAGTAGLARADHYIRLTKPAHIVADTRTIDADDVTAMLTPDDKNVQSMQLRANSRIVGTGDNAQSMSAQDIDLTYAPDGRTLQHARLMERAVAQLAGTANAPGQRIAARTIDMGLATDGTTLTDLNAVENVVVDLPAQGDMPAKTIKARSLVGAGTGGAGLQSATFEGPVEYRESRAARGDLAAIDRTARAARLTVETKPGFGDLQQADFRGNVKFIDGETTAEAPRAVYQVEKDRLDLSPSDEPGRSPTVSDPQMVVQARAIELTMSTNALKADTNVRSVLQRRNAQRGGRGGDTTHFPSMLKQDENVTITSNRLEYDSASSRARYVGAARLSQGTTEIKGDTIDIDDKSGNLSARVGVRTRMKLEDVDPKTNQHVLTDTNGTGDSFVYDDAKRLAVYTGTPTAQARLVGAQGDVTGDRIELYLKEDTSELDRLEAEGKVVIVESTRTAFGKHLTYTAADDTYVLTGPTVELYEPQDKGCKKTRAQSFKFRRAVDNIETTGKPVDTQAGVACPARRD
jgi:LPS export ABC transporter protein LptC/lipopolysaccharide transport protein LptA